jgi:hypothetical protein
VLKRAVLSLVAVAATGCATTIAGTPTWPGARLEKALLTKADFPAGVEYGRIIEPKGQPDSAGGPPPMLSVPQNCSNGLTDVISAYSERGPGSAAKYNVIYDGARIVVTVLTSPLNISELSAEANRCRSFDTYFDRDSEAIPITTKELPSSRPDQLTYQQTMRLAGVDNSVFMSFENVGDMGIFGIAFPTGQLGSRQQSLPKATLPQTFTEIVDRQAQRIESAAS